MFLRALDAELGQCADAGFPGPPTTIYIGGGTPSVLTRPQLARLFLILRRRIDMHEVEECTVECNPGTVTPKKLVELRQNGVTRISLGAQAMTDAALAALGRLHGTEELAESVRDCRAAGFTNVALDLIAGLPGCGRDEWRTTLEQTLELQPTHVSVYALSVEDGTGLAKAVRAGQITLPGEEAQLQALEEAEQALCGAGLERYEISNYSLPGRRCRHNMAYWLGRDYLGIGPAAASRIGRHRWTNVSDVRAYVDALAGGTTSPREAETVDSLTDAVERLVFGLRLAEGIPEERIAPLPVADEWLASLRRMAQDGLVARDAGRWRLTCHGRALADSVIRELMVA